MELQPSFPLFNGPAVPAAAKRRFPRGAAAQAVMERGSGAAVAAPSRRALDTRGLPSRFAVRRGSYGCIKPSPRLRAGGHVQVRVARLGGRPRGRALHSELTHLPDRTTFRSVAPCPPFPPTPSSLRSSLPAPDFLPLNRAGSFDASC